MFTFNREKQPVRKSAVALYGISGVLLVASTLIYIYPSMRATSLMYDYSERLKKLEEQKELNKKLKLETASMFTYEAVERKAVTEMGFIHPAPEQVVIIAKK